MKKIIQLLLICSCSIACFSQVIVRPGAYITGRNGMNIVFNDIDLVNNGNVQHGAGDGSLKFTGIYGDTISGSGVNGFDRLLLAKSPSSSLYLKSDIKVGTEVVFLSGLLDMQNNKVDLGTTGMLTNESESSRAFSSGIGYLESTRILNQPSAADPANLGILITSPYNLGSTIIRRRHDVQTVYNSNSSILRYFDVIPAYNTALKATVRFKYFDAELNNLQEATLSQWKCNFNNTWVLAGADIKDATVNFVEKAHNGKLMRYTLSTAIPPSITCPADIVVDAGTSSCTVPISFTGNYAATATGIPQPLVTYQVGSTPISSPYYFPIGKTIVTAIASDGVNANATCSFNVVVTETVPPVITSCPPANTLCYNTGGTYSLTSLSAVDNCSTVSVTYNITGATTRSGSGNNASGVFNVGTSYINWLVSDASGNTTTCTTTISVVTKGKCTVVSPAARIAAPAPATLSSPLTLNALPNPSNNVFKVYCNGSAGENIEIKVVDILGRLVDRKENIGGNTYFEIGKDYLPGTYILQVTRGRERASIKLIKQ